MSESDSRLNPYQPAIPIEPPSEAETETIPFQLTSGLLRYGESQYLLHWRSGRLVAGSLTMIVLSAIVFVAAMFRGSLLFGIAVFGSVTASTIAYTLLIRRDSVQIRQNLQRLGLVDGAAFDIEFTGDELALSSRNGIFRWPRQSLRAYRTRKGILLCPEPLTFVLIPKAGTPPDVFQRLLHEALPNV